MGWVGDRPGGCGLAPGPFSFVRCGTLPLMHRLETTKPTSSAVVGRWWANPSNCWRHSITPFPAAIDQMGRATPLLVSSVASRSRASRSRRGPAGSGMRARARRPVRPGPAVYGPLSVFLPGAEGQLRCRARDPLPVGYAASGLVTRETPRGQDGRSRADAPLAPLVTCRGVVVSPRSRLMPAGREGTTSFC